MSKLNIDQKTISELFADKKADFLIPDYQRPYAWEDTECQTLWEDIFSFAFPDNDYSKFNSDNDEYFLGPIVTFKNDSGKMEIIDGQQRLTTLMLLLRAFYEKYGNMKDENSKKTRERLEKCIWKTDEFGTPNKDALKINSEVATDNDKDEFLTILRSGKIAEKMKSKYALNYQFFQDKINDFLNDYPSYFSYLPTRILNNCILLPIEAESQDTALRIFSTLNDRGLPLSDADIFKAQFYKYYSAKGEKDTFIRRWKSLEDLCEKNFHPITGTAMDELFTRYMYYERSLQKNKSSTTEALRKFYEKNSYALLKKDDTLDNLECLADFWNDVSNQDSERFSERILKQLFVLNYAPNGMWNYFVSVYFMHNKNTENMLDEEKFSIFLNKITAFIWTYAFVHPGLNALRTPVYTEMINIIENKSIEFSDYLFDEENVRAVFHSFKFDNRRPITKSMITWWAFQNEGQELLSLETTLEIEHIYAKKRQENEQSLKDSKNLEILGNKALLEKRINIRAADYRIEDKRKYYIGFVNGKKKKREGTKIVELRRLAEDKTDFMESDIVARDADILNAFIRFLRENKLLA
ncbi:DUF262 domain-containing protein [Fibrobacter sp.]|uniref:DUF262 domain-containing protein n=1 Tax=Fibrobacter sp. TaxID=35828 RepID=UPI00386C4C66